MRQEGCFLLARRAAAEADRPEFCEAKTRRGTPCRQRPLTGKRRCRLHGGLSTGPRTAEGRARIAEAQKERWRRFHITRKGMAEGYAYKRVQVVGGERYHDKPNKNRYSHPCEAGQYMMLGAGEGQSVVPSRKDQNFWRNLEYDDVGQYV